MCLHNHAHIARQFSIHHKDEVITCYKVLAVQENKLYSPYMGTEYGIGENVSDAENPGLSDWEYVDNGIHVYMDMEEASAHWRYHYTVVVPVTCRVADLIGMDYFESEAVFNKVELSEADYRAAIAKKKPHQQRPADMEFSGKI